MNLKDWVDQLTEKKADSDLKYQNIKTPLELMDCISGYDAVLSLIKQKGHELLDDESRRYLLIIQKDCLAKKRKLNELLQSFIQKRSKSTNIPELDKNAPAKQPAHDKDKKAKDDKKTDIEDAGLKATIEDCIITEKTNITWNDIAGLENVKQAIREAVVLPLLKPELFVNGRKPWAGILLFGPPGTGKTLMAKAAVNECNVTFYIVDAASVVSKWVGESEKLIKTLFKMARDTSPSLIFMDEVDALTATRDSGSEISAERRMKTQLLQEMQGIKTSGKNPILIIGATNRPWDLDPAFLRRFEKRIYVPLPDLESRKQIFKILTKKFDLDRDVDFSALATITDGYSGSDIEAVCNESSMAPLREKKIEDIINNPAVKIRPVRQSDFVTALSIQKKVTSEADLQRYKKWMQQYGI